MNAAPWPAPGAVHLSCLPLPRQPAELARLASLLAEEEIKRAARLKDAAVRQCFVAGRGMLREILGGYLGVAPGSVQFAAGEHGKPCLPGGCQLRFNLAHAGAYLLLAVAAGREVGVDLEQVVPGRPFAAMARLVFSPHQQERLAKLAAPVRETVFYRHWVRTEACLKGCGRGFSLPGGSCELSLPDEPAGMLTVRCGERDWQVQDITAPLGYCAALAVETTGSDHPPPQLVWRAHP